MADLRGTGVEDADMPALVAHGDLEGDLGTSGGLLEDERDLPADQSLLLGARGSGRLQLGS